MIEENAQGESGEGSTAKADCTMPFAWPGREGEGELVAEDPGGGSSALGVHVSVRKEGRN